MKKIILSLATLSVVLLSNAATYTDLTSDQFRPDGWVEEFLNRQVTGLTGHPEQSGFPFDQGGWINGLDYKDREIAGGKDWFPYEQAAYYLDGALRCGYMVNNHEMKSIVRENIDYVLSHVDESGQMRITTISDDWWPIVVFIRIMIEEYEVTGDQRLLDAMVKHYKATYSDGKGTEFNFSGFSSRSLLHVEHLCSLYGYTGDRWFIEMAETLYDTFESKKGKPSPITANGMNEGMTPSGHAVTYHEFMKLPATLYYYTGKERYRTAYERAIQMLESDHELADGLSSAVEFLSGKSAAQAHELCNSIDYNWSVGWALLACGNPYYADKMERCLYNSGIAAVTPDFRAHQYYSAPNMATSSGMSSDYNDNTNWGMFGKKRLCYRPGHDTECCSGNVHRMLPTFINRSSMWNRDGVKINFYLPGTTRIDMGGADFEFTQQTNYPHQFSSKITIERALSKRMNLSLRIPYWAESYKITLNGGVVDSGKNSEACYKDLNRKFVAGDVIEVSFDTTPKFVPTTQGVAVNYGALVYSMPIEYKENRITCDGAGKCSHDFPAYEYMPVDPLGWAYALVTDGGVEVVDGCDRGYMWDEGGSPTKLKVKARAVKNWKLRGWIYSAEYPEVLELEDEVVTLTLEPIGTTKLRITDFPVAK
ncbi:MAG: beta-L-arabinofuranosidase domain-containing protein [Rikenellaceae bacterium]